MARQMLQRVYDEGRETDLENLLARHKLSATLVAVVKAGLSLNLNLVAGYVVSICSPEKA